MKEKDATDNNSNHVVTPESVLEEALYITTNREQRASYGTFEENFQFVVDFIKLYKEIDIDVETVCLMLIGLKFARNKKNKKRDNLVDIIGYVKGWAEISGVDKINKGDK